MDKEELFICECSSAEHQIIMTYDKEDNQIFCTIHLTKISFWKRLKYFFGYKCRYGCFEEFIFKPEDADRLQIIIDKLKAKNNDNK